MFVFRGGELRGGGVVPPIMIDGVDVVFSTGCACGDATNSAAVVAAAAAAANDDLDFFATLVDDDDDCIVVVGVEGNCDNISPI